MPDDYFALLGEPHRPFLDPEQIKEKFHHLSRTEHPDQQAGAGDGGADAAFARLNQAQAVLRDPKARLRHLLELTHPEIQLSGPASVPPSLADLFAPIHGLLREIDDLLAGKAAAPSALAKALLARREWSLREQAEARLTQVEALRDGATDDLRAFDTVWEQQPREVSARLLHDFYHRFAYLGRWAEQLRERLFQLGL